jgi:hypothetical protein
MDIYEIELTFKEPMLGTVPKDKELYKNYIASKAPVAENGDEEVETVQEMEEKGWTGFHCLPDGSPFIYDYMIKGFFKAACSMLSRVSGKRVKGQERVSKNHSSALKAFKKVIDGLVFIEPRQIPIEINGEMGVLERPLRAMTAQGERVALSRSDTVPAGSKIRFKVRVLGEVSQALLEEWLDYGQYNGLGQWRNASYGSFTFTLR